MVSLLEKDKALENGKMKASLASLDYPERESIKKIIYALDQMGALEKVNSLLSEPVLFDTIKYYDSRDFLFEKIGLSVRSENKDEGQTIYLSSSDKNDYIVTGYERIFIFNLYKEASDENIILQEMNGMSVIICKKLQDTIPLNDLLIKVDERNTKSGPDELLNEPYDISTKTYKHRLYIKNLNYQKKESKLTIDYLQAVMLSGKY